MEVVCSQHETAGIAELIRTLTKAWNSGDSRAFASLFAEDGDMINIYGMRVSGRRAIAGLYDMLFRSVFRRSRIEPEISGARELCDGIVMVQARVALEVPLGAMAGDHEAVCSVLVQRRGEEWRVTSLHNTLVSDGAERQLVA